MAQVRVIPTPVPELRGKLRNVVGTLEILIDELKLVMELSSPHCKSNPICDCGPANQYDALFDAAHALYRGLRTPRDELRRFLSKPRQRRMRAK